jgi:hypothetical protein
MDVAHYGGISSTAGIRQSMPSLPDAPGLGIELDDAAIATHPYVQNPSPSLSDAS